MKSTPRVTSGRRKAINSAFMSTKDESVSVQPLVVFFKKKGRGAKADLARQIGETQQTINNWIKRGFISQRALHKVAPAMGMNSDDYRAVASGKVSPKATDRTQAENYDAGISYSIPVLAVTASMGNGAAVPEHDTVVDNMRLTRTWIHRNVATAIPQNLAVISAYGDSMAPTFNDGDILLVDRGIDEIKIDAVYVLRWRNELFIKRVQRRFDGSISIISDNQVYAPVNVKDGERDHLHVLGRVVWAWNGRKL